MQRIELHDGRDACGHVHNPTLHTERRTISGKSDLRTQDTHAPKDRSLAGSDGRRSKRSPVTTIMVKYTKFRILIAEHPLHEQTNFVWLV